MISEPALEATLTFEALHGGLVVADRVLQLPAGLLQVPLQLLVFLLQLAHRLGALLPTVGLLGPQRRRVCMGSACTVHRSMTIGLFFGLRLVD